jgi:hypothetical protein
VEAVSPVRVPSSSSCASPSPEASAAPALRELSPEECLALGAFAAPVVAGGKIVTKLYDTSYAPNSIAAHAALERNVLSQEVGFLDLAMAAECLGSASVTRCFASCGVKTWTRCRARSV